MMMEIVSAFLVGVAVVLLLRYSFGRQISNGLLGTIFTLVFSSLAVLNYFAEPFTVPFQAGVSVIFIAASVLLIIKMPPQKIDPEKQEDPVKATAKDSKDMAGAGVIFLLAMLLMGIFYFVLL